MAAHCNTAGAGLDRFQPIETLGIYPGEHCDNNMGIKSTHGDQAVLLDRFWGRENRSLHSGHAGHRGAFLPAPSRGIRSPMCPRCKLLRVEAQLERDYATSNVFVIDGVHSICCCPNIQMPSEKQMASHPFLRRHSRLWAGQPALGPDVVCEEDIGASDTLYEKLIRAPVAVTFEPNNMPFGGESINPLEGHAGKYEDVHVVEGGWINRNRASNSGGDARRFS